MSMKINKLEIENVKRVKAVKIEPTANGLTIIGGRTTRGRPLSWMRLPGPWEGTGTVRPRHKKARNPAQLTYCYE